MASQEVLSALESLQRELAKLEPAIKHVKMAEEVTRMVTTIPKKQNELFEQIVVTDEAHKQLLLSELEKEVATITSKNNDLVSESRQLNQGVTELSAKINAVLIEVTDYYKNIQDIHFPERLDKLDASVTGIMTGVQTTQGRIDMVELNLKERIGLMDEKISKDSMMQKRFLITAIVLLVLIIVGLVLLSIK